MAQSTIPVEQAGSIFVDKGPEAKIGINLSVMYMKTLPVLLTKNVGNLLATLANAANLNAGTAIYYLGRRNFVKDYKRQETSPDPVKAFTIQVLLDYEKVLSYTVEEMDLARMGASQQDGALTVSSSLVSTWNDGASKSMQAYLHAKATQLLIDKSSNELTLNISESKQSNFDELRSKIWLPLANLKAKIMGEITSTYIGIDTNDLILVISPNFINYVLLSQTVYSEKSRESLVNGEVTEIAGLKIQVNNFLGRKYSTNTFDQDESFDFSSCEAILLHKEAVGFPWNNVSVRTTVQPNTGNLNFIHKFLVNKQGGIALRPSLIIKIKFNIVSDNPNDNLSTKDKAILDNKKMNDNAKKIIDQEKYIKKLEISMNEVINKLNKKNIKLSQQK